MNNLILLENHRFCENSLIAHLDRGRVDLKIPITEYLLFHQDTDNIIDFAHLLIGLGAADC